MRRLGLLLLASTLAAPLATRADGSVQVDLSAGIARPFGQSTSGINLSDGIAWGFPLQADIQFRFLKQFAAGPYVRYTPTVLASSQQDSCSGTGVSCNASDLAFGGLFEYRFSEKLEGGPWLGGLVGWEMLKATVPESGKQATSTLSGLEIGVRGGMDFELGGVTIGPWGALQLGQFTNQQNEVGGQTSSGSITSNKSAHGWYSVGVRVALLL
jgi:hypothetical protein